ncbi:haloacid dehalogenase [Marasmius fiardii PR-910]|nr:haloacid dehalogenase [Marasmius fiardii PR-910]
MALNSGTNLHLKDFEVIFFDVYGTLCDWETGIYDGLKPVLSRFSAAAKWSRKEALEAFTAIEIDLQAKYPGLLYRDLLAKAHEVMEERLRAASGQEAQTSPLEGDTSTIPPPSGASTSNTPENTSEDPHTAFGNSIKDWPLFPDTVEALRTLAKHYKLCVLSNVDRTSFAHTLAKLSGDESCPELYMPPSSDKQWFPQEVSGSKSPFTLILTAQDVGSYKPALRGFEAALDIVQKDPHFGQSGRGVKERVLWVAQSLFHDVDPATKIGLKSVWIDRAGAAMGLNGGHSYIWKSETLGQFAKKVSEE